MELASLKKKIKKNENFLKISKSLEIMCITRLKQLKQQMNYLKESLTFLNRYALSKDLPQEIINVFFFTDMSFCGDFNKHNLNLLKVPSQDKVYVIGMKGAKQSHKTLNIDYLGKLYDKNILQSLYERITLISNAKKLEINLWGGNRKETIYYEASNNLTLSFHNKAHLKYTLSTYMVNFKYEECKLRLMKVTTAINNNETLQQTLKIMYNKTRKAIITGDLLEVISGSQTNEEDLE